MFNSDCTDLLSNAHTSKAYSRIGDLADGMLCGAECRVGSASSGRGRPVVTSAIPHDDVDQRHAVPVEAFNDIVERRRQQRVRRVASSPVSDVKPGRPSVNTTSHGSQIDRSGLEPCRRGSALHRRSNSVDRRTDVALEGLSIRRWP